MFGLQVTHSLCTARRTSSDCTLGIVLARLAVSFVESVRRIQDLGDIYECKPIHILGSFVYAGRF
jgi:hypothetical protein